MSRLALDSRIFVAGHRGLVGSALLRRLRAEGFTRLLSARREELDLRDQAAVGAWFAARRPEVVFLAAGTVGGILANRRRPAEFLWDNLMIHANVVEAARRRGTRRLIYLASSCIYPRDAHQPLREEHLLSGRLEPTNEAYAIAKIAGVKLCESYRIQHGCDFISLIPTNVYGPGDHFADEDSHVLPALLTRFHAAVLSGARRVVIWGSGRPRREFVHADDLADACLFLARHYDGGEPVNVGTGDELSIAELAERIRELVGYRGELVFDGTKPDGMPRKLLDVSKLHRLGWRHRIGLDEGLAATYGWLRVNWDEVMGERSGRMAVAPVAARSPGC